MPTCKALQVWLKRPEIDNFGKNQIVMIKPSMLRQGFTGHALFSHFGRVFLSLSKGRQEGLTPWPSHLHSKVS